MSSPAHAKSAKARKASPAHKTKPGRKPGAKRARTREKLLDAASELFLSKGISAVSVDEVAAHAGLTKGAIYGNFEDKDDLIYAVTMERLRRPRPVFSGEGTLKQQLRAMVREAFASSPAVRKELAFLTELDLYTLTHEGLAKRLRKAAVERYLKSAENLAKAPKDNELPLTVQEFAIVVHALFNGLLFQRAFFPNIVTEKVAMTALEALAD